MLDIYIRSYSGASFNLLFWRAFCDFGLGLRFIFIPAYNRYICNNGFCDRESGGKETFKYLAKQLSLTTNNLL
jgi:hypothetical protein